MVLELYPDPYDCANEEIAIARFLGILIEKKFSSNSNRTHTSASSKRKNRIEKEPKMKELQLVYLSFRGQVLQP